MQLLHVTRNNFLEVFIHIIQHGSCHFVLLWTISILYCNNTKMTYLSTLIWRVLNYSYSKMMKKEIHKYADE